MMHPVERSRPSRDAVADDRGTTLLELTFAMALMSVFMVIFTTATLAIYRSTEQVEDVAASTGQARQAFTELERTVRYATGISVPGPGTGDVWHVEYSSEAAGCTQLRVAHPDAETETAARLQLRTWRIDSAGAVRGLSAWRTLSTGVNNWNASPEPPTPGTSDRRPFVRTTGTGAGASEFQRLTLVLTLKPTRRATLENQTVTTYTALNSRASSNAPVCQQVDVKDPS